MCGTNWSLYLMYINLRLITLAHDSSLPSASSPWKPWQSGTVPVESVVDKVALDKLLLSPCQYQSTIALKFLLSEGEASEIWESSSKKTPFWRKNRIKLRRQPHNKDTDVVFPPPCGTFCNGASCLLCNTHHSNYLRLNTFLRWSTNFLYSELSSS